jgi:hypothetical protein
MDKVKYLKSFTLASIIGFVLVLIPLFAVSPSIASASYSGGRLIDNNVFLHSDSMSKVEIQSFLEAKNSGIADMEFKLMCYGADSKEHQSYTAAGADCDSKIPASHIIYYASQIYGVNPRVVLSTLQKEQSLVTSQNPTDRQVSQAMGYACPTSGSCNSSSNFSYQIDSGTWVLRWHYERANGNNSWWRESSSWTCGAEKNYYKPNLYPGQNVDFYDQNNVKYRTHYIDNAATSAFYCYTPHTYNNPEGLYGRDAYGTKGMYYSGSYNFVYWFETWFGSTTSSWSLWSPVAGGASWSTTSPVSLTAGDDGRFTLLAMTKEGTLKIRRGEFGGRWGGWANMAGGANWTSANAAYNSKNNQPRIFAIDKTGQMYYRYLSEKNGWSTWSKVAGGASWSATSPVSLTAGDDGRFTLLAMKKDGALQIIRGEFGGRWGGWAKMAGGANWTSANAAYNTENNRPRIFAIDKTGQMYYRYYSASKVWSSWAPVAGGTGWSTTAPVELTTGEDGDFNLTALTTDGTLEVRRGSFGDGWGKWYSHAGGTNWTSATSGYNSDSNLPRILVTDKDGQIFYRYKMW